MTAYQPPRQLCRQCGAPLREPGFICGACGAPQSAPPGPPMVQRHPSHGPIPEMEAFQRELDESERWTRRICVGLGALGLLLALVALLCLPFGSLLQLGSAFLLVLAGLAFLYRGLKGEAGDDAFVGLLSGLPSHLWLSRRRHQPPMPPVAADLPRRSDGPRGRTAGRRR